MPERPLMDWSGRIYNEKYTPMNFLKTVGKDGHTYYFKYKLENQYDKARELMKVCFKTTYVLQKDNNWFDFKVALAENNLLVVTDMFDTMDFETEKYIFKGKGLPEALIREAQKIFPDKTIVSDAHGDLWPAGRKVWERLVQQGSAEYIPREDRYQLLPLIR